MMKQIKLWRMAGYQRLIFLALGSSVFLSPVFSQFTTPDKKLLDDYNQYRSQFFKEKLYVHTDKESYLSREICWYRIYYMDGFYHAPADLSKIAYVEILDRYNRPVIQQKTSLLPGESNGSFVIPVSIPTGSYTFRAYTNWMKNSGPECFFEKAVQIINPHNLMPDSVIVKSRRYDIQFFPEGGNLIQGIESRIGFRVTDAFGKGQSCEAVLFNLKGDTLTRFRPLHFGLGHFSLTPDAGQQYRVLFRFSNGETVIRDVPTAYSDGLTLQMVRENKNQWLAKVSASPEYESQEVYLMIHGNHSVMPVKTGRLNRDTVGFTINAGEMEDGISRVTLFNRNGEPVCERLVFTYPRQQLQILADAGPDYGTRKKIDLDLATMDEMKHPQDADLSVSVYRLDSLQHAGSSDIRTDIYLSSELGFVESPSFYFDDRNENRQEDIDNLMLTHGWRRFNHTDSRYGAVPPLLYAPEYNGHIITGTIISSKSGKGIPATDAYLSVPSVRTQYRSTISDSHGRVKFELPGFYGSHELIVQTNPRDDSSARMEIDNPFFQKFASFPLADFPIPDKNSLVLQDLNIYEQVQRIYGGEQMNQFIHLQADTNPFYVVPDEKYLLDDYTRFQSMEEVFREYIHSLNVVRKKDRFELFLFDNPNKKFFEDEPLILMDGVPFFYTTDLFKQDPLKIRRIDLVNRQYSLGSKTYSGIVNLTTYHGDLNGIELGTHLTVLDYPAIPEARQFFSPEYETEKQINSRVPDYRRLLYWNPGIRTGRNGKKQLTFYSSDLPGKYVVVIQGLSDNGMPGSEIRYFNVSK